MKKSKKLPRDQMLLVCDGEACRKAGSRDLIKQLKAELKQRGAAKRWTVARCSCLDACEDKILAVAMPSGVCYRNLRPKHAEAMLENEKKERAV